VIHAPAGRLKILACVIGSLTSCGNEAPSPLPVSVTTPITPPPATASHSAPELVPERTTTDGHEVLVFRVDLRRAQVTIADLAMSTDLEGVLSRTGGSLAVNGGFFTPDTRPEGLAVSEGRELSTKSLDLGGGVLTIARRRARLFAVEDYSAPDELDFAIQCRPRLVVGGAQHVKKHDGREAERTALCLRDGATLEVVIAHGTTGRRGPTLSAWSGLLAARGCEGALNLDGGPSTGAAWREGGTLKAVSPRAGIRHAVVVSME